MSSRDNRLNTPAEALVRLVFVARGIFFFVGFVLALAAANGGAAIDWLKPILFFVATAISHLWLRRGDRLAECYRALDGMFSGDPESADDDELEALLQRRALLEEQRGQPGFDPWAVQGVRREISDYVSHHPESASRLDDRR